jgi:hypothetical protein
MIILTWFVRAVLFFGAKTFRTFFDILFECSSHNLFQTVPATNNVGTDAKASEEPSNNYLDNMIEHAFCMHVFEKSKILRTTTWFERQRCSCKNSCKTSSKFVHESMGSHKTM